MGALNRFYFIYPVAFMASLGFTLNTVGSVFFLRDRYHVGATGVGQYAGEWALAYMVGCLLLKDWLPRQSVARVVLAALVGMAFLFSGIISLHHLPLSHVMNTAAGFLAALFWPPLMGWASAGLAGPELSRRLGWYNLTWSSGTVLGPVLAGALVKLDPRVPLGVSVSLFLLCAFWMGIARALGAEGLVRVAPGTVGTSGSSRSEVPDAHRHVRWSAWVGLFTTHTLIGVILNIFPIYALRDLHLDPAVIGGFLSLRSLFTAATFVLVGRLAFWQHRHGPILVAEFLIFGTTVFLAVSGVPLFVLAGLLSLGVLLAFSYVASIFHSAEGVANPSSRMAWHESILTGGILAGAFLGGLVYDHFGMVWVWVSSGLFILLGMGIQTWLARNCIRPLEQVLKP